MTATTKRIELFLNVPPNRKLALPRPDLSAREAVTLIQPFTPDPAQDWKLTALASCGALLEDGRLHAGAGGWQSTYHQVKTASYLEIRLFFNGNLGFRGSSAPLQPGIAAGLPPTMVLPDDWLDSTEIAAAVRQRAPAPTGVVALHMSLVAVTASDLVWDVHRYMAGADRFPHEAEYAVDARSGEVLAERVRTRSS